MTTSQILFLCAGLAGALSIALLVLGIRGLVRNAAVRRVRLPARLLRRVWVGPGEVVDVEYPAPDGTPLQAQLYVNHVRAPGLPMTFDGTVWVNVADPSDVTPRRVGRNAWGTAGTITGGVLFLGALVLVVLAVASSA